MTTLSPKTDAIVISQYQVLLDDIQEAQSNKVESFDYESPKGNKAARSYIYSLRLLRGRIESAHKDAKAYALEYGRKVDSQAKELSSQVEALILPHQEAIDTIARREAVRLGEVAADADSAQIKAQLKQLERETLVGLEEFEGKVAAAVTRSRQALQSALTLAEAAEAQAEAKAAAATAQAQAAAQAQANAERRAAEAEAQAATAVQATRRTILPEPVIDWVPPVQPTPAALEHFIERLLESMGGKSRDAIAEAIALGTLHPAVRVDWAQVCTSTELRHG